MPDPAREYTFADLDPAVAKERDLAHSIGADIASGDPAAKASATAALDSALHLVPAEPADALGELLAPDETPAMLNIDLLRRLAKLRAQKALYADQAKALTPEIEKLNREVAAHIAEVTDADFRKGWNTTVDNATAYVKVADYPKYRHPEDRPKPYGMDDLIPALRTEESTKALVKDTVNGNSWNSALRRMVEAWRERCDETGGPTNADGDPVDAFGNVLTDVERDDPTADELALPPSIREMITVSTVVEVMFRQK